MDKLGNAIAKMLSPEFEKREFLKKVFSAGWNLGRDTLPEEGKRQDVLTEDFDDWYETVKPFLTLPKGRQSPK